MPAAEATILSDLESPPRVSVAVKSSIVMELVWALCVRDGELEAPEAEFPARAGRFDSKPDLYGRIREFWDDGDACYSEVLVAAGRGGVLLEEDPERIWAGLARGAAASPQFEPLTSESAEDRTRFRARLALLHADRSLRARWLLLLQDTWAALQEAWAGGGRNAAEAAAWQMQAKLPAEASYSDLAPLIGTCDFNGLMPRLIADCAAAGQKLYVLPSWLGRNGYVVTLADGLVWGPQAPPPAGPSEETHDRARRYKALGDPTRLAIFETVARRPRTVGDLAAELGIAQPTVSNHVRVLRDSGLLVQEPGGGRRLAPDSIGFERFLDDARRAVVRTPGASGSRLLAT